MIKLKCVKILVALFVLASSKDKAFSRVADTTITIQKKTYIPISKVDEEHIYIYKGHKKDFKAKARHYRKVNKKLRKRILQLERAMLEMQDEMQNVHRILASRQVLQSYTCYINTSFKGTHYAKGSSLVEARALALKKCEKTGSFSCKPKNVVCD